ncbi:PAP2 superfamily protein [Diaporthe helianthi]|uniref:PAP2 superfamily protein n=1 Tax=Diaporthe helianthi TaxID=158607 RepID=A0A2P5ICU4_DIAHE|nr:PAP2 superfamily protein [Diaporthe helianthi]
MSSLARFWMRSYAPDYIGFAILVVAYALVSPALTPDAKLCKLTTPTSNQQIALLAEPFHRLFYINDLAISFPHADVERVPVTLNVVYAAGVPLVVIVLANSLAGASRHKHHVAILGLAIALILTSFLTDTVKNTVGRPRPDLVARCKPAPGTPENKLVGVDVCTETRHHVLHDGWRSFPSGHSSFSFAGLGYLSLFLAGQLRLFVVGSGGGGGGRKNGFGGPNGRSSTTATATGNDGDDGDDGNDGNDRALYARGDLARALLCLGPLLGAAMIAISRCQDYRHDVYDVCTGALLGYVVAYWSYRRYWPHLSSRHCHEPYPNPGTDGGGLPLYGRLRDEEEGNAGGNNVGIELGPLPARH